MPYVDAVLMAVPEANKQSFIAHARGTYEILKRHGALSCMDAWGNAVPESMRRAVALKDGEVMCVGWLIWPDKATHDAAWATMTKEMNARHTNMPFDRQRMIFGGFEVVAEG
jgi:uncharacterized protein YbaA (DUF1428 family)